MTLAQLRQLVSGWVDDKDNGYFTTSDLNSYINQAAKEVQKIILQSFEDQWVKCVETYTVVNQQEYNLPSDFKKLNRIELVLSGNSITNESRQRLYKITRNQQDSVVGYNTGTPAVYFFQNNKIIIQPAPDSAKVLRLDYTYTIADMSSDSDTPDIPDEYQEFIAVLAAITCLTRDTRDASTYIEKRRYYEQQLKRDAEQRNIDEPRTVVQTQEDDGGAGWWF